MATDKHLLSFELSSVLSDAAAYAADDGQRRALRCEPLPAAASAQVCVAAWHATLHWLRYNDEPVITCLLNARVRKSWPIVTETSMQTSLADLLSDVQSQWMQEEGGWLDLDDCTHGGLLDQLRCQAVRLHDDRHVDTVHAEFEIIATQSGWEVECAANRFTEAYQHRVMALWRQMIVRMLDNPTALLSRETYDVGSVAGPVVPILGNLVERFLEHVTRQPHSVAVLDSKESLTYAELDRISCSWARSLRAAGVEAGQCVGVAFERNWKMVSAQLAIWKLGAVFVPMDAEQPKSRLEAIASDTAMSLALTEEACVRLLGAAVPDVKALLVDDFPISDKSEAEFSGKGISTDDLAYVVFTSGSTGRPKGVKVSHGNLLNFVLHYSSYVGDNDVVSQFAPFTFDASVAEIHGSLLNGARLVILTNELIENPDRLQDYLTEQQVTFAAFPPQYARHLSPARLPSLKMLLTAGSAPDHELIKRWQPHLTYVNAYGPTETTVLSTAWHASRVPESHEPIVMGSPIANTEVRVVNRFNRPLPRGVIGELLIGGAGVAQGYLSRQDLTRERFIESEQRRWYRSGDLSCFNEADELIFAGRVDNQVKLRGHRLEPGEVEAALLSIPGIRQAAVLLADIEGTSQLVAFCVGERLAEEVLREQLSRLVPSWAVPNRLVWLDNLPLTLNGKTDYKQLRQEWQHSGGQQPADGQEYADELEAAVAEIWSGVLHRPSVSRDDNFIHLGGDSLTALVVISALKRLGYASSSSQILSHPRLADFVALLQRLGNRVQRDYTPCIGSAPLSPIQGWFFALQLHKPGVFCQTLLLETAAELSLERLQRALARLTQHHDQLRAHFVRDAGEPTTFAGWHQEILTESLALPPIEHIEVADSQLDEVSERCRIELADELSIERAPLFRVALLVTPTRSRVVWVLHHLIVDTISHGVLLEDLRQLYEHVSASIEQVLPGKSISYLNWSQKLLDACLEQSATLLPHWQPLLDEIARAEPLPLRRAAAIGQPLEIVAARLSRGDTARLIEEATACYHQSAEEIVLAATYLALSRTFAVPRVAIDIEWHGRDEEMAGIQGLERTIGWFTSVHPLCVQVPTELGLGDWLIDLKERRAAIANRGRDFYALRYLSRDTAVRSAFAAYRSPQVLFNFSGVVQRRQGSWYSVPAVAIELGEGNPSPYDLSVESEIRDGELIISFYHQPAAWPAGGASELARAMTQALQEVIAHCCEPSHERWTPSDFPQTVLTQSQVDELPRAVKAVYPLTDMQHTLFRHKETYQVSMCYRIPRPFNESRWRVAVVDWIGRHDCLRTYIQEWSGDCVNQVVLETVKPLLNVHRTAAGNGARIAQELVDEARRLPIQLAEAPLFDIQAVDDSGAEFRCVLTIHHIIHDGWSIELLLSDLLQTYLYYCGEPDRRPAAPLASIADVVAEQSRLRTSAEWRAYWAGLPWQAGACQLPDSVLSSANVADIRLHVGSLDADLTSAVRARAHVLGITINSLWLTGYVCLLRFLGGQRQVRCGVTHSGRVEQIPGIETITGCCVNTLPLVLSIEPTRTLAGIVAEVNSQLERIRAGAVFPLSDIHNMVRTTLDEELFSTLFNVESHLYGGHRTQDRVTLEGGYESTNYSFVFGLIERADAAYDVRIGYDANRYDTQTVERWLTIYASCMRLVVDRLDSPWNSLQILPEELQRQIVLEWNATEQPYPHDRCVAELFREQATRLPEHPALLYRDQEVSYRELDARSEELARVLQAKGVKPETIVGLVTERSLEGVIAILAIYKAGGAYVPLDPNYPVARIRHMLLDAGCKLVLFQRRAFSNVIPQDLAVEHIYLDEPIGQPSGLPATVSTVGHHSRQLAYVMYTSGSTGHPKGVMIEQRSILRLVRGMTYITFAPTDRILLTGAMVFDATTFEIWIALLNGLTLTLIDEETLLDSERLAAEISDKGIATLWMSTPLFNRHVQEKPQMFAGMKQLLVGGEALSAAHVQIALQESPDLDFFNVYGPTENTTLSTYHPLRNTHLDRIAIGRPITNSTAYVLNSDGQLLPPGVNGELVVGGPGVARGYLNQPELTAEKFVRDPFSREPDARLYRTGDLVRWRDDGLIDFLGRIDNQVKIRGFRVELGEIENAIQAHGDVKQVLVLLEKQDNRERLIGYVVPKNTNAKDEAARNELVRSIFSHLQAALPNYMVPAAFMTLDAMPLNTNGKIDRGRLPPVDASAYTHNAYVEPGSECERVLWAVWKDVLGIDSFGVTDDFYAVGGDSILAIQVVARATKQGLTMTTRQLIEKKTIRDVARLFDTKATASSESDDSGQFPLSGLSPVELRELCTKCGPIDDIYPCTGMQQSMLSYTGQGLDSGIYLTQMRIDLDGVEPVRLRRTWQGLIKRHSILRTAFADVGQSYLLQVVLSEVLVPWRELDARRLSGAHELEDLLTRERVKAFDMNTAPLMRLLLVRLTDQRYRLVWTYHHALFDGWSLALLMQQLFESYIASTEESFGAPAVLEQPVYKDYIQWLRAGDRGAAGQYWRAYLEGVDITPHAGLPVLAESERTRESIGPIARYEQKTHSVELSVEVTTSLTRLARSNGVSLGTIMLAAWGLLLSKYSSAAEVVFGYTSSGRPAALPGVESMVGLFITTLPLRLKIDGSSSLASWLQDIQRQQLDQDEHSVLELAEIQRLGGLHAGQALFDSVVVVENFPVGRSLAASASADGLRIVDIQGVGQTDLPLNLVVYPGARLTLQLAYQMRLFAGETILTVLRRLAELLTRFGHGSQQKIAQISMLTSEEQTRAVRAWNDTNAQYASDRCLPDLFTAQAHARPKATAIVSGTDSWTYEKLSNRVQALSAWLSDHGVAPGDAVALSLHREPDLVAAMIAIMHAGATYVPVALDCPSERRAFMAADAGIKWTLTRKAFAVQVETPEVTTLLLEEAPSAGPFPERPSRVSGSQGIAYIMYTSGTTGKPKGVAITQRSLVNFCQWLGDIGVFGPDGAVTQFAPFTFDVSAGEIFPALLAGAALHLFSEEVIDDPRLLERYLSDHRISFATFPPPYLQQLDPARVPRDITILTIGSAPTLELAERWGTHCRYINAYGPTETTIYSTIWKYDAAELAADRTLSIGRPINNTVVYIVDPVGQLCAPGLVGELLIGGDGVAHEYVNRPELTQRQFIRDPWTAGGGRLYRTGDLARWLPDGRIEFIGRRDRQVKVRGFRIELGEIESRLREHASVKSVVVAVRGKDADAQIFGWVVFHENAEPAELGARIEALQSFLRQALPPYMLPQALVPLEQLPLNRHGKVDEKALPQPDQAAPAGRAHVAPRNEHETRLTEIWAAVLKCRPEQISATADFFELGGHSLLAMRVIARVREEWGVDVAVTDLFRRPLLEDQAVTIQHATRSVLPPITPAERDVPLPLSFAQQRLWFMQQLEGVDETYHMPGAISLSGVLDREALGQALDRLVVRHEILRTTIKVVDGEPVQQVGPADSRFKLRDHDLSGQPEAKHELQRLMDEEVKERFDFENGPLARGRLVKLGEREHVLLVTLHHIVMDGWSMEIMIREFSALYRAYHARQADPLPPLTIQYGDYAVWQRRWLAGAALQEQGEYWRRTLEGAPVLLELPTDRPRPAHQQFKGELFHFEFDESLTAGLEALSQRCGTTMFMTLLAGWSVVLSRLSGQEDIVIGAPVANRTPMEVEPLLGCFVNAIAVRLELSDAPTVMDLLQRAKTQVLGAQQHQQVPFEQVVEIIQPPRSLAHHAIFQVWLNWLNIEAGVFDLGDLQVKQVPPPHSVSRFDLKLGLAETAEKFVGSLEYATTLFDRATIERHVGYLRRVLEAMVLDEQQLVERLPLIDEAERRRTLVEFNTTDADYPHEQCIQQLFEAQVARDPDSPAVEYNGEQLTYGELNRRANQVAHELISVGIRPEDRVAICVERSLEMVVGMLGILKAGGAYVPLDPTYPVERLAYLLKDSTPAALLIQASAPGNVALLRDSERAMPVVALDEQGGVLSRSPSHNPDTRELGLTSRNLAYVIYTSGSTGQPKGVMVEHRSAVNFWQVLTHTTHQACRRGSRVGLNATYTFDMSFKGLLQLLSGHCVVIIPQSIRADGEAMVQFIEDRRIDVLDSTPSQLDGLLRAGLIDRCKHPPVSMLLGGEPIGPAMWQVLKDSPTIHFFNMYGPTECTVDATIGSIRESAGGPNIGKPVVNTRVYVLDAHLQPVPIGVTGEMYLGGVQVARGYLGQQELTAQAFLKDPFVADSAARMYKTGDLARYLPNGTLEYVGRRDFQVKIRGFRIELSEIEISLSRHAAVREAVVIARDRSQGDKQLVAYVTTSSSVDVDELRAYLRAELPDYMVPSAIVRLDALPLTRNGKLDRDALPDPNVAALEQTRYEAPRNATEELIASIWQQLLEVHRVGRQDSFFDLGGNSILLIRMLGELRRHHLMLNVTDAYRLRTLEACSTAVAATANDPHLWLQSNGWKHHRLEVVSTGGGPAQVLLLDQQGCSRKRELQKLLAQVDESKQPDFVRVSADIDQLKEDLQACGLAALASGAASSEVQIDLALSEQLRTHEQQLAGTVPEEEFPFSPTQQNMLPWTTRDSFQCFAIQGWYGTEELQTAFARLVVEQDLLRSIPDGERATWKLLPTEAAHRAALPAIDLRMSEIDEFKGLFKRIAEQLLAYRKQSALPYAGVWVSASDTRHYLLLAMDHLIWDGASADVFQRRLPQLLHGSTEPLETHYRDYVAHIRRSPDPADWQRLQERFEHRELSKVMEDTLRVLEAKAHLPLQSVRFKAPVESDASPAAEAFEGFKRWFMSYSGLDSFVTVFSHHARLLGERAYFDQIGLFLDKLPFVVDERTQLEEFSSGAAHLHERGLTYLGLEYAAGPQRTPVLPPLSHEIHFNYQAYGHSQRELRELMVDGAYIREKLGQLFGVVFEAAFDDGHLLVNCSFRGEQRDLDSLLRCMPGASRMETDGVEGLV